ncbi:Crp/Fnr family transcriptional regulator [Oscillospiraceae bacterium LTW-04]|nr:Crp/Fnr family transcriptional regulator [Oscillospiraceae bacterium MB24-C1]
MKKYLMQIKKSRLFAGIDLQELEAMLSCLSATVRNFKKGDYIIRSGDSVSSVALVASGSVHIQREDFWGNRTILSEIAESGLFGESYACAPGKPTPINAVAAQNCTIIFLDVRRIITTCSSVCAFHARLIQNLITVLAFKNIMLTDKIEHISQRSTREKLLSYLSEQAQAAGSSSFDIPFNRQQLADYLCVDRSAMSNALGQLRDEGVLNFNKSHFELL